MSVNQDKTVLLKDGRNFTYGKPQEVAEKPVKKAVKKVEVEAEVAPEAD